MKFSALPQLSRDDLMLRPIVEADLAAWAAYLMLPAVYEHTSWNLQSASELQAYVWDGAASTPDAMFRLAIARCDTGELIGTAGFHTVSSLNRSAELTYDLAPSHWSQGIGSQVCAALTEWAHDHCGVLRVQATVLASNLRAVQVLERNGFAREGLLRSFRQVRGKAGDFWMYSHIA
jgi:ribosomal-protein-alanine N-acetyltransferase